MFPPSRSQWCEKVERRCQPTAGSKISDWCRITGHCFDATTLVYASCPPARSSSFQVDGDVCNRRSTSEPDKIQRNFKQTKRCRELRFQLSCRTRYQGLAYMSAVSTSRHTVFDRNVVPS